MSSSLAIYALGGLTITWNGTPITHFETRKMEALLVYLAHTRQSQSREFLGEFLWDDRSQEQSLSNLRTLIHRLRQSVELQTTRRTIDLPKPFWLDAYEVSERVTTAESLLTQGIGFTQEIISSLEYALSLYQGDFLAGFYVTDARNFDDWMFFEREQIRLRILKVTDALVETYLAQGATVDGIRHAQHLLKIDPLQEKAQRQLMQLYMQAGQRGAALAQYEACQRLLAEELDIEPSPETQALYAEISRPARDKNVQRIPTAQSAQVLPDVRRSVLPLYNSPFVGRERELVALNELLDDRTIRLISIIGAGGMGKTRLALEVAASQETRFPDSAFFVALAPLTSADAVQAAIAEAVGMQFFEGLEPLQQLLGYFHEKSLLLVMDNFEHVLGAAALLSNILRVSPGSKILTTSRESLNLEGERIFQVEGMDYPALNFLQDVMNYSAVKLFLQSAQRIRSEFAIQPSDLIHLALICKQLSGMPLAILLAASWVGVLSLAEISQEIAHDLDFLENQQRDTPERHRSMRTVFGYSWGLLSEEERRVYAGLSIFRGDFTREAAQEVTGASLHVLRGLVNKSLLHRNPVGRYELHELLRQFAASKLVHMPDQQEAAQARHCHYYADYVVQCAAQLYGPYQLQTMTELEREDVNIQLAWEYAATTRNERELHLMTLELLYYFKVKGIEAEALFQRAFDYLATQNRQDMSLAIVLLGLGTSQAIAHKYSVAMSTLRQAVSIFRQDEYPRLLAMALLSLGNATRGFGEEYQAVALYQESIAIFKTLYNPAETSDALYNLARYFLDSASHAESHQPLIESLDLARRAGTPDRIVTILVELARLETLERHYEQAQSAFKEIFDLLPSLDSQTAKARIWHFWGNFAYAQNDLSEAERRWTEAMRLYQETNSQVMVEAVSGNIGLLEFWQGKYTESRQRLLKSVKLFRDLGLFGLCGMLNNLGHPTAALERYSEAERYFREALGLAIRTDNVIGKLEATIGLANLAMKSGRAENAAKWLAMAIAHPDLLDELSRLAKAIWAELQTQLSPDAMAVAQQHGKMLNLDAVGSELLNGEYFW